MQLAIEHDAEVESPRARYFWGIAGAFLVHALMLMALAVIPPPVPPPEHAIVGRVVDEDGQPVVGVTITDGIRSASTREDGRYALRVPSGEYVLVAALSGRTFLPSEYTVKVENDPVSGVDFTAQLMLVTIDLPPLEPSIAPVPESPAATQAPNPAQAPPAGVPPPVPPVAKEETKKASPTPETPKAPEVVALEKLEKRELHEIAVARPMAAFEESKETAQLPPPDAYASDKNSTAADRGPKDLPRGDPFRDKGESAEIRYGKEKRGEGNAPALHSDPRSGSVKQEGTPNPGEGARRKEPPAETPQAARTPEPGRAREGAPTPVPTDRENPLGAARRPQDAVLGPQARPREVVVPPPEKADLDDKKDSEGEVEARKPDDKKKLKPVIEETEPEVRPALKPVPAATSFFEPAPDGPATEQPKTAPQNDDAVQEKAARELAALLGDSAPGSGAPGERKRRGERGHEGDGTPRAGGHDEAVSDVTTFNLNSSAELEDDARFAKRRDPYAAYFKPLLRRTDGKWKAANAARMRRRFEVGSVVMRLKLRKDGVLVEASEVERFPRGLPSEFVAIAREAIQAAAYPSVEPFPPELQDRETIEITINFLYR